MSEYRIDERDMMFLLKECPGISKLQETGAFDECDEDTLDMIFEQSNAFCQKVLAPLFGSSDKASCHLKDGEVSLPPEIGEAWQQFTELGLTGMTAPADYGGSEMPNFFSAPVTEMQCNAFMAFSMLPMLTRGSARLIESFGTDPLKDHYLERMYNGEWSGTMCLTEPGAGSDVGAGVTKAVPDGDAYKISGTKIFITWGEHNLTKNIIHLVLARLPDGPPGSKGLSLFVVPKYLTDADGNCTGTNDVICGNIEHKMGIKASPTCVINFGTEGGSTGYMVGAPHQGMSMMFQMMNEARIEVGIQGLGIGTAAYLSALDYARERVQGSIRTPDGSRPAKIIEHQDVRRMLLKMRALTQGGRAIAYNLMQYLDLAHSGPEESRERYNALVELITPICKSFGSDQGFRVTEMAVQTYGGFGYCSEYPVEQYMRDCKITSIYEGTNGIQALDLVFRKIIMNKGAFLQIWGADVAALCGSISSARLAPMAKALGEAVKVIGGTAHTMGMAVMGGKADQAQFYATDFQEAMSHVMASYFLLEQAKVSEAALAGDCSDADKHYYEQKLVTTAYYFCDILPGAVHALTEMTGEHVPGLAVDFG